MSYQFTMRFKEVKDAADVLATCQSVCSKLSDPSIAVPYIMDAWPITRDFVFAGTMPTNQLLSLWIKSRMQVKFVYWPALKILAMAGNYPDKACEGFSSEVLFQDSTDQDYDMDTWDSNIFKFYIQKTLATGYTREIIIKHLGYEPDDIEYARRSILYERIFKMLDLKNWLYGRDGDFQRITMSALDCAEKESDILAHVLKAIKRS